MLSWSWSVYLGSRASGWGYRYRVLDGSVFVATRREAQHIVRTEFGTGLFAVENGIGTDTYFYETREDRDADVDGSRAVAVVTHERLRRSLDIAEHGGAS
jgi:hypothetical protein